MALIIQLAFIVKLLLMKKHKSGDFPGGLVGKTPPSNEREVSLTPGWEHPTCRGVRPKI